SCLASRFFPMIRTPPSPTLFPYTTLFRSARVDRRGDGPVRAHEPACGQVERAVDRHGRVHRATRRDHDVVPRRDEVTDRATHLGRELAVVADERAVDVERDEERACHATGVRTSRPPRYGRRPSGTRTEPSACWWFSRIATIQRVVASVPLRVATMRVEPSSVRSRTPSRRAWKVVQFEVEVSSSHRSWLGSHASQSNLRAALVPRSPAAVSITR